MSKEEIEKQITQLNHKLDLLNEQIERQISFKRNFFLVIIKGVGSVLGATVITAILFTLITRLLQTIGWGTFIKNLLDSWNP